MKFTKMTGIGNDYVYVDGFSQRVSQPSRLAIAMSNRNFGVGSDGLVLILPSRKADCRMRMFNSDGSEAEMCGNAIRCVAKFVHDRGLVRQTALTVETACGIKPITLAVRAGRMVAATVEMGAPILEPVRIPVAAKSNRIKMGGFAWTCVSMGNPHAVTFVKSAADAPVLDKGPVFEHDSVFPRRCNIEFAEVVNRRHIRMRVWERGAGETLACGTGACATAVAGVLNGLTDREVDVELTGGTLHIAWSEKDNGVRMTGGAEFVFDGVWLKG
ncbi:MAG: diaminopimelate epimerase [Kiritimatiellia bacterium]